MIEAAARGLRFTVEREDDFKVRMEWTEERRKGALVVTEKKVDFLYG